MLIWFTSGLVMSLLPIDVVHGDHRIDRDGEPPLPNDSYAPVPALIKAAGGKVRGLQHRMLLGRPIVEAQLADGRVRLIDARTAAILPLIDARAASTIARSAYRGDAPAPQLDRINKASTEYRGALPAWRASFADDDATRIFISAETGRLTSVRTGTWRLYDFFWGLHIMDWTEHERFNTPWLRALAASGLAFGLAGAILLWMRWPRRRRRKPEIDRAGAHQQEPKI